MLRSLLLLQAGGCCGGDGKASQCSVAELETLGCWCACGGKRGGGGIASSELKGIEGLTGDCMPPDGFHELVRSQEMRLQPSSTDLRPSPCSPLFYTHSCTLQQYFHTIEQCKRGVRSMQRRTLLH